MSQFHAFAATSAKAPLQPYDFNPGELRPDQVEIAVRYCGICHSDLSMLDNEWGISQYPFVPGHEAVGTIVALGSEARGLRVGQTVGLGWFAGSCLKCPQCLGGDQNLCATGEQTIVGRYGAFADRVRCQWTWAVPLPEHLDPAKAGPLFCGGITVFNPIVQFDIQPTQRVGVIGIGGLGHLALQFLNKWGCEVTAFTSSDSKAAEAKSLGAHNTVNSRNSDELKKIANSLDFIISTASAALDWDSMINALAPKGRLHFVGVTPAPVPVQVFSLIMGQRSVSGSPLGSPSTTAKMLDFCARHNIAPVTEMFPFAKVNDALEHLRAGKARYRVVLDMGVK